MMTLLNFENAFLSIGLALCLGCSSSSGGGSGGSLLGNGNTPPTQDDQHLNPKDVVAGCVLKSTSNRVQGAFVCVDFFNSAQAQVTTGDVQQFCAKQEGEFVNACPTNGVTSVCRVNIKGITTVLLLNNDSDPTDMQEFTNSCNQQGGNIKR